MPGVVLPPLPQAAVEEISPSLHPEKGELGSKREVFECSSTRGAAHPTLPASPAGPNHLCSCSGTLAGLEALDLLAAAFVYPYGQAWAF